MNGEEHEFNFLYPIAIALTNYSISNLVHLLLFRVWLFELGCRVHPKDARQRQEGARSCWKALEDKY